MEARPRRPVLLELMILIGGVAIGLALIAPDLHNFDPANSRDWLVASILVLGGLSLVGPPLLLWERRRRRSRWRAGELIWFTQGMASWLLWPPVVVARARGKDFTSTPAGVCYLYGTPLVALYVGAALLAGGWIGFRRRRRRRRPWHERFGLMLALAWACTGLYVLALIYREDLK